MNQVTDKFKRVKYLRALEKFAKSAINGLKRDDFDESEFRQRVEKNAKVIEKVEAVYLDQPYSRALENFINLLIKNASKEELLKAANLLDKLKNQKTYKKEKHKNNHTQIRFRRPVPAEIRHTSSEIRFPRYLKLGDSTWASSQFLLRLRSR